MKLRFVVALMTLLVMLASGSSSRSLVNAEQPDPGKYSAAEHELVEFRNQMVPVRDEVKLAMDIFRPAGEGQFPVVLSLIPYNKDGGAERARWLAARGYAVGNVDVRGRYESEGDWDPFDPRHKTDGYDLVEWLAVQPWSTGKVGMWGFSDTRFEDCMHTPYIDLNKLRKVEGAPWFETWIRENLSTAAYWQDIAYQTEENYAKVKVPSLAISGWFDADFPGTPMNYTAMKQYGGGDFARRRPTDNLPRHPAPFARRTANNTRS